MRTVALDLLGSVPPAAVTGGVAACLRADPDLAVVLVGPPERAAEAIVAAGLADLPGPARVTVVAGRWAIADTPDAEREVRARRDASVRVAARLVRDGAADAFVSFGPTRAVVAAAGFAMGTLPGVTRTALAEVLRTPAGPVVVLDRGAWLEARGDQLAQYATLGSIMSRARFGVEQPIVGLLSADGTRRDGNRRAAEEIMTGLGVISRGVVSPAEALAGDALDVLVTDGLTGSVLFGVLAHAGRAPAAGSPVGGNPIGGNPIGGNPIGGNPVGGNPVGGNPIGGNPVGGNVAGGNVAVEEKVAVVAGVNGIAVAGGAPPDVSDGPHAVATAIGVAVELHRGDWLARQSVTLADLVAGRRRKAGLPV